MSAGTAKNIIFAHGSSNIAETTSEKHDAALHHLASLSSHGNVQKILDASAMPMSDDDSPQMPGLDSLESCLNTERLTSGAQLSESRTRFASNSDDSGLNNKDEEIQENAPGRAGQAQARDHETPRSSSPLWDGPDGDEGACGRVTFVDDSDFGEFLVKRYLKNTR